MSKPRQDATLRITEIFYSLQGESATVGTPTVFIRLTGCPLRCHYCDTAYAFSGGSPLSLGTILERVKQYNTRHVTVTGGEPLAQQTCLTLLTLLCDQGYIVSLETSGALDVADVDPRVVKVMDIKTPGSHEQDKNNINNLNHLTSQDQLKFVICNKGDYDWAKTMLEQHALPTLCQVFFSPSYDELTAKSLAEWILADQLPVRMQIQLHKVIWGDVPGV